MKISRPESVTGVLEYDPELRFTPGGHQVATFGIVDHQSGEITLCEMWRELADKFIREYDNEQRMKVITVYGKLNTREWTDRNEQIRVTKTFTVTWYEFQ